MSVHPFTGGSHPTDVRITTRYSTGNWLQGVAGTVHEVGHALYEQGRNSKYDDLPVSRALSMGVHESQSLLWERMIFQVSTYVHVLYIQFRTGLEFVLIQFRCLYVILHVDVYDTSPT